jgi:hypothetical protein
MLGSDFFALFKKPYGTSSATAASVMRRSGWNTKKEGCSFRSQTMAEGSTSVRDP